METPHMDKSDVLKYYIIKYCSHWITFFLKQVVFTVGVLIGEMNAYLRGLMEVFLLTVFIVHVCNFKRNGSCYKV